MYTIDDFDLYYFAIPMNARFRGITLREGVILHGPTGWGEFCPFDNYADSVAARWLRTAIESASTEFPMPFRTQIPVNAIIPATTPSDAYERTIRSECTTAKVKISDNSSTLAEDITRLQAVRKALGSTGKIRIDINGLWSPIMAIEQLPALIEAAEGIDYVEQPSDSAADLRRIKEAVDIRISADELIRLADDPFELDLTGIADVAILKATPLNGIEYSLRLAQHLNLPVVVSSALETSIGMQSELYLAATLPELYGACGFGTLSLLDGDLTRTPLAPIKGFSFVHRIEADPALLTQFANPDPVRVQWWKERLIRCFQHIQRENQASTS